MRNQQQLADGFEVTGWVVLGISVHIGRNRVRCFDTVKQGVSVSRRGGCSQSANHAAGAGAIVDEHGLAHGGTQLIADQPCHHIWRNARWKGNDQTNWAVGVSRCLGKSIGECQAGGRNRCLGE